jgi:hypothetical protein
MKLPSSGKWSVSSEQYLVTSSGVKWAFNGQSSALKHVSINHGGFHILVTKQFLDRTDIVAILQ